MPGSSENRAGASASGAEAEATIILAADLHARPAGALSMAAAKFTASVRLIAADRAADAKSVLAVMQLGATAGTPVTVRATGPDAADAVAAVTEALAAAGTDG